MSTTTIRNTTILRELARMARTRKSASLMNWTIFNTRNTRNRRSDRITSRDCAPGRIRLTIHGEDRQQVDNAEEAAGVALLAVLDGEESSDVFDREQDRDDPFEDEEQRVVAGLDLFHRLEHDEQHAEAR